MATRHEGTLMLSNNGRQQNLQPIGNHLSNYFADHIARAIGRRSLIDSGLNFLGIRTRAVSFKEAENILE